MPNSVKDIKDYLDKYVIGQDEAKDALATAGFMHWLKSIYSHSKATRGGKKAAHYASKFPNPRVLLMGPSGSGKTYITEKLSEVLDTGFYSTSVQHITNEGFVGMSISDHIQAWGDRLINEGFTAGEALLRINYGILFIDEIDKLGFGMATTNSADHNLTIQHALLTAIEGQSFEVKLNGGKYDVKTNNMFIITAGAFSKVQENRKKASKETMGFKDITSKVSQDISLHNEIIAAGLIPEIVGRLSIAVELHKLDKESILKVIRAKDSVFEKYSNYFQLFGFNLEISDEDEEMIVNYCDTNEIGLRALNFCMHRLLTEDLKDLTLDDIKSEDDDEDEGPVIDTE